MRFSLYEADYSEKQPGNDETWTMEYDQALGLSVGVELEADPVGGRIELMFVDDTQIGFLASVRFAF